QVRIQKNKCQAATQALALAKDDETRQALEFLYAYMASPDWTDYSPEYFAAQAEIAVRARKEMAWGSVVPDREWLHFVLPVRVNNENLDEFRTTCYEELKARVKGLGMMDAAIEANRWCHEHVTYKPSDSRTSSPLASMRTSSGRCGEESTYGVATFRAIGIPARQVYTPRWAHTDDNHAWVEVWVNDGPQGAGWYFLGACEPEPVLNLGWFNQPASRGMLMHTNVYGRYDGPEDKIEQTNIFCEINVTDNYARTARSFVTVVDEAGQPVSGADVHFKIYNYGEFYSAVKQTSDAQGKCSIQTGIGDIVVWGSKDGKYGFEKVTAGSNDVVIRLTHSAGETYSTDFNLVPPPGHDNLPYVSPEAAAANELSKAREDSIRNAYVATFPDEANTRAFCQAEGYDYAVVRPLVEKSRGNYANLYRLLKEFKGKDVIALLHTMSDKDIRDFDYDILADHIVAAGIPAKADAFAAKYVYCPRIANEMLSPWRSYFQSVFSKKQQKKFAKNPELLADWLRKNIVIEDDYNPARLRQHPETAHKYGKTDSRSIGFLFVAAARSMGIPARIDEVTGKVQYTTQAVKAEAIVKNEVSDLGSGVGARLSADAEWTDVLFGAVDEAAALTGNVALSYTPREYMENPRYYNHFSISNIVEGQPNLLEYAEDGTWSDTFAKGVSLDEGDYILTSGTRLADGSVLAHVEVFPVKAGDNKTIPLVMRQDQTGVQVIGNFNSENTYYDIKADKVQSLLATTGRGYFVTGLIRANHEPSNHILHDISALRADLEAWGRPIVLLFRTQEELDRFNKNNFEFTNLPSTLSFGVDTNGEFANDIFNSGIVDTEELPIVLIGDTFNRVVFRSQGYTIGLGEQIKQTVGKIK
ncbi:MAG: transglutaminase domain-containing protein, partial [Bacteroidales bacterium]|nr:transglutaminase domain-containing protein [Bacteroidales bacterium]